MDRISTAPPSTGNEGRRRFRRLGIAQSVVVAAALALPGSVAVGVPAVLAAPDAATCALMYLHSQQAADGLLGSAGVTDDYVFGAAANGYDPRTLAAPGGASAYDYLAAHAGGVVGDAGATSKLSLAVIVGHLDPTAFGGQDLLADLDATYKSATGAFGDGGTYGQALGIMTLVAAADAGHPLPAAAVAHLRAAQNTDGSWNYLGVKDAPGGGDTNSTAIAIQALAADGVASSDASITAGLAYLAAQQLSDAGFPYSDAFGPPFSDPDSDATVIQALVAVGENPAAATWQKGGVTPRQNMLSFRNAATGGFVYPGNPGPDAFTTSQVPAGLAGVPFPGNTAWTSGAALPAGTCATSNPTPTPAQPTPTHRGGGGGVAGVTPPSTTTGTAGRAGEAPTGSLAFVLLVFVAALFAVTRTWIRRASR
ncbi:MAG: hypothetical protein QOE66_2009 [Chloroflexota bacterium]|nr:hypothetical protein [Chloroflexota bacterium]